MNYSKIIGMGSYGYVYYPSLFYLDVSYGCGIRSRAEDNHAYSEGRRRSPEEYENIQETNNIIKNNNKNKVSKLLKKEFAEKELFRYELIRTADPDNKFHLGNMFIANPSRRNIPLLSIHENGKEIIHNLKEYKLIVMRYGGKSLREYGNIIYNNIKKTSVVKSDGNYTSDENSYVHVHRDVISATSKIILFWKDSLRLIKGIECFIQNHIVHHDIKTANILFRYEDDLDVSGECLDVVSVAERRITTHILKDDVGVQRNMEINRSNYIDFGLVQSMESIYEKSKTSNYNYSIFYYNFPPELFFYDKERFDVFRNLNMEERKLWFQYICTSWIGGKVAEKDANCILHANHYKLIEKIMKIPNIECLLSNYEDNTVDDDFEHSFQDSVRQTISEIKYTKTLPGYTHKCSSGRHRSPEEYEKHTIETFLDSKKTEEIMIQNFQTFLLHDIDKFPDFKHFMKYSLYTMDIYGLGQTLMYMLIHTQIFLPHSFVEKMQMLLHKMMHNNVAKRITITRLIEEYTILLDLLVLDKGTNGSFKTSL